MQKIWRNTCNGIVRNCLDIWDSIENWDFSDIGYESYAKQEELTSYCKAKRECSDIIEEILRKDGKIE
jgi:hypothetical protein